jgi:hypothetical protein
MKKKILFPSLLFVLLSGFFFAPSVQAQQDSVLHKAIKDSLKKYDFPIVDSNGKEFQIFEKVDIEASVDNVKWRKHLEKNLLPFIERAATMKIKDGTYTVLVRFLVEKDGRVANAKAIKDPGYGLAEAAESVVSTGPLWQPGEKDGKPVRSYHIQPITFVLSTQ